MPSMRGPLLPIISGGAVCGRRQQDSIVDLPEAARERDAVARQQPADDRERLLEARDAVVVRDPERAELLLVPAGAEPEHEAAAADLVDRRGHPRDQTGRVEPGARDERPEPHALRRGRERGELGPGVPGAALRRRDRAGGLRARSSRSRHPRLRAPSRAAPASAPRARPPAVAFRFALAQHYLLR